MYIIKIAEFFGSFPFASFSIKAFPFWIVAVTYVIYAYILLRLSEHERETPDTVVSPKITAERTDEIKNDYEGWVIEETKETPRETSRASRGDPDFPFR